MDPSLNPADRPSRLSLLTHLMVVLLTAAAFLTGVVTWRGQWVQAQTLQTPEWLRLARVTHGGLNPFLCGLFGYLVCQHIRLGWRLKANLVTGLAMEGVFAALILTGTGLYYVGAEEERAFCVWAHRILGLLLPVSLAAHWIAARIWVRQVASAS
jgi:hypothetical protein